MKHFLKYSLFFLLIFFIIDKGFYYFLDKAAKLEYDQRLEKLVNGEINKELIILGSSRGADNILAGDIERATKLKTYNLSYQGADITFQHFILKTLLKYNKPPKKIVLSIDNPFEFDIKESLIFRIDRLQPLSKYNYINDELIYQNKHNLFSKIMCLSRLQKEQITFNSYRKTSIIPIDEYGSMPLKNKKNEEQLTFKNYKSVYLKTNESSEKLKAFKHIQGLCKDYDIELFYVFSPSLNSFNTSFFNRFMQEVQQRNRIILYDTLNPIYKNPEYFYDESHLNAKGAKIFTSELSNYINLNQ